MQDNLAERLQDTERGWHKYKISTVQQQCKYFDSYWEFNWHLRIKCKPPKRIKGAHDISYCYEKCGYFHKPE